MFTLIVILTLVGHVSLCVMFINRLHSTGLPHWFIKSIDVIWYVFFASMIAWFVWLGISHRIRTSPPPILWAYGVACWVGVLLAVTAWIRRSRHKFECPMLTANHTTTIDLVEQLGHRPTGQLKSTLASHLPANQILKLHANEKQLYLPRLHHELDGLSIVHLSDLHLTGQLLPSFYDEIVRRAVEMDGDFIVITGDIIDKRRCLPWVDGIFSPLRGRLGTYFVLGNHDVRIRDVHGFREQLRSLGLVDLGNGRWTQLEVNGQQLVLSGTELPWFKPCPDTREWPDETERGRPLRVLLSHSPDQIRWAQRADIDLLLAGHTHGGQIRLPFVGPTFSPSRFGAEYASGTFYCEPTVMHVSRGISGTRPLRIRCAPELTKLVLRSGWPKMD